MHERRRRFTGASHVITAFIRLDDPYSWLLIQVLPELESRFDVVLVPKVVGPIPAAMNPDPERLRRWAHLDASRLAGQYGLEFPKGEAPVPSDEDNAKLSSLETQPNAVAVIRDAMQAWWRGESAFENVNPDFDRVTANDRLRARRGHYASAMLHYGGEWYWSLDRLNHLEARLIALGRGQHETPRFIERFRFLTTPPGHGFEPKPYRTLLVRAESLLLSRSRSGASPG